MGERYEVAIVGGGLIGLATAHELLRRRPGLGLAVVEKETELALHQSGRNSGVLHSGLYYKPGSFRARLCREGKATLEAFADEHAIPHRRLGKIIVAVEPPELGRLAELKRRGLANGVQGLDEIGPERIRELEPHAVGLRALHVPETGVIDFRRVALALGDEVRADGGQILLERRVVGIESRGGWKVLATNAGEVVAQSVIACAGLQADRVAAMTRHRSDQRIIPFRGDYYRLLPAARRLVRGLIYPVPDPPFPFLGVHFTRRIDDEVWAGPNAVLALAREGYRRRDFDVRDAAEVLGFRGFRKLVRKHWRAGARELWRDLVKRAFVRECRRYIPELRAEDLTFGPSGVRAQAVEIDGSLVEDFSLGESPRVLHVRNAPSPAATACLAIGRLLAERAIERLEIG